MRRREIKRVQGTDGIRGRVASSAGFSSGPLETFLEHEVLTEQFFELYCYCHVKDLIERNLMKEGDEVLIGWDSRDREGFYTYSAVAGIAKAGGTPGLLGVIPTPGVALALVEREAATAFMITASHNPKDQNGIKIFLKPSGMKMLPEDDEQLTEKILATDYSELKKTNKKYPPRERYNSCREMFIEFHKNRLNSLVDDVSIFSNVVLVVDSAHGATAGISQHVFREVGFSDVVEVAVEQNGNINENSGVALLEGVKEIPLSSLAENRKLAEHKLVKQMATEIEDMKEAIFSGERQLIGVTFDGDGDRFFLLAFNPTAETFYILSGDECAALLAEYLIKTEPKKYRGSLFVHSVESDINVSHHVASLGFKPMMTGVGDKWILQQAIAQGEKFGIGCEETGHSIHGGFTFGKARGDNGRLFFAGNGLKGAVNTLVAIKKLGGGKTSAEFWQMLKEPFEPGFKKTAYSYYVNKSLFCRDSKVWETVENIVREQFASTASDRLSLLVETMESEPDMLYMLIKNSSGTTAGSIFIRNSGTEDKIGVSVRGALDLKSLLEKVADAAVLCLMQSMKNVDNQMAEAEKALLASITAGDGVAEMVDGVNYSRLLTEMEIKQRLIKRKNENYMLTELGRKLIG